MVGPSKSSLNEIRIEFIGGTTESNRIADYMNGLLASLE